MLTAEFLNLIFKILLVQSSEQLSSESLLEVMLSGLGIFLVILSLSYSCIDLRVLSLMVVAMLSRIGIFLAMLSRIGILTDSLSNYSLRVP